MAAKVFLEQSDGRADDRRGRRAGHAGADLVRTEVPGQDVEGQEQVAEVERLAALVGGSKADRLEVRVAFAQGFFGQVEFDRAGRVPRLARTGC